VPRTLINPSFVKMLITSTLENMQNLLRIQLTFEAVAMSEDASMITRQLRPRET
jgi:hypothetical protein